MEKDPVVQNILVQQTLESPDNSYFLRYKELEVTKNYLKYYNLPAMPNLVCFSTEAEACLRLMSLEEEMLNTKDLDMHMTLESSIKEIIQQKEQSKIQYGRILYSLSEKKVIESLIDPPRKDNSSTAISAILQAKYDEDVEKSLLDPDAIQVHEWFTKSVWLNRKNYTAKENFQELLQELLYECGYWIVKGNLHTNNILVLVNGNDYLVLADRRSGDVVPLFRTDKVTITNNGVFSAT